MRRASKTFPGVRALVDFDFDVRAGSVHALLGHNGCGKSTLIKALAGVHAPDPGAQAWIDGEPLAIGDGGDALRKGLRFVHQELGIIPQLGAVDNVGFVLGYARGALGKINWRAQARRTTELLRQFGFALDPWLPLGDASPPERAAVAIVRAVAGWQHGRGVLILDEPTAALPAHEVDQLFALIREISATGTAVILVSHRLDEVMAIADHVTVMRSGRRIWDGPLAATSLERLIDMIANTEPAGSAPDATPGLPAAASPEGAPRAQELHPDAAPRARAQPLASAAATQRPSSGGPDPRREARPSASDTVLEVRDCRARYLRGVSFSVATGEILGVAGLLGSGREELPYIIAGDQTEGVSATFIIGGVQTRSLSIGRARALGVALVPADRAREGIFGEFSTRENVSLAALPSLLRARVLPPAGERRFAERWLRAVHAEAAYGERLISTLSGGNQQKAVVARWLAVSPRLLVLSEPTAGVDIGARQVIYAELRRRAAEGLSVLIASSDIEDLLATCDRVIVLRDGMIVAELASEQMTKSAIAYAMEGAHSDKP